MIYVNNWAAEAMEQIVIISRLDAVTLLDKSMEQKTARLTGSNSNKPGVQ